MKIKTLLILICLNAFILSSATADVFNSNNFSLRGGFSFNHTKISTDRLIDNNEIDDDDDEEREDEMKTFGFGFVTSVAYRFQDWEFAFTSDAIWGRIKDVTFVYDQNSIRGGGHYRLVSIGPQIKYYTPYSLYNRANFYIGIGPAWSLQTYVFRHPHTTGNFNDKRRVSFENYGGGIFIGLEEILPFKEKHPYFLEIGYSYMHSYKVSILDSSDSAEVITLSEGDSNDFSAQYLIVRAGITLF